MRRASRGVKRKSYAPRREADSKRNFLFVNCPHEKKNELAAGKQNTRIIIIIIIIAKEEEEEQTDTRTSISFNLSSSLTLNKEYPAGVSNKSSILREFVYLARLSFFLLMERGERDQWTRFYVGFNTLNMLCARYFFPTTKITPFASPSSSSPCNVQ